MKRYIYAVTKELPKESRESVAKELDEEIHGMMNRLPDHLSDDEKMARVLKALGHPKKLANKYRGKNRYLIGPKYFERYVFVLQIVSLSIFVGVSIAHGFAEVFSFTHYLDLLGSYLGALITAILQGAAWVTGIFALLEYNDVSLNKHSKTDEWSLRHLPEIPDEKAKIARGESVFSIVLITLFLTLFFISPEMIGFYSILGESRRFVPLFILEELFKYRPLIFGVFTLDIFVEVVKILKGRWTKRLAVFVTVLNVISSGLLIYIFSKSTIYNDEITTTFEEVIPTSFDTVILIVMSSIVLVTIIEAVSALYKGYRYGK